MSGQTLNGSRDVPFVVMKSHSIAVQNATASRFNILWAAVWSGLFNNAFFSPLLTDIVRFGSRVMAHVLLEEYFYFSSLSRTSFSVLARFAK